MKNVNEKVVRIRLIGAEGRVEDLADKLVNVVEASGYECIEWTRPFPCRPPDDGKFRLFLTFVVAGAEK